MPMRQLELVEEVGPEARNTSSRVMVIFTARPDLRDSASATGSRNTVVLPPKPPPISEGGHPQLADLESHAPRAEHMLRTMK